MESTTLDYAELSEREIAAAEQAPWAEECQVSDESSPVAEPSDIK
jgi:hypothetical protein